MQLFIRDYLAYSQDTNIKRKKKYKEQRIHHQTGFWPTSRLKQGWEVPCHSTSGVPNGKRSQAAHPLCSVGETSTTDLLVPIYNPWRLKWIYSSNWDQIASLVLPWKTWNVVKPGAWLVRSPPGAQLSQDSSHILSLCRKSWTHSSHSQSLPVTPSEGSVQVG